MSMNQMETFEWLRARSELADELLETLKVLVAIAGEANIPLTNAHAVRKMGKFIGAMEKAKKAIAKAEGLSSS